MTFKLIIAGSRGITDYQVVRQAMIESGFWDKYGKSLEIVCGMAKGVDLLGRQLAKKAGLPCKEMPAEWDNIKAPGAVVKCRKDGVLYNVKAGYDRNIRMAEYADGLLLVWDGVSKGSKQMLESAYERELEVYVYMVGGR